MDSYVITISRQFASLGRSIAQKMSEMLQINFYDRDIVESTAKRMGQPVPVISQEEENASSTFFRRQYPLGMGIVSLQDEIYQTQSNIIKDIAQKESCIIVGRCGYHILEGHSRCLNVYIYAPYEVRLDNCIRDLHMDSKIAKKMIKEVDKARENYRRRYYAESVNLYDGYHLMIDSSKFGVDAAADILVDIVKKKFY